MKKETLKAYYLRFCRWQQAGPRYINRHEGEVRHCNNCGTEFSDNFCPRCGQRAEVGRVGWSAIRENITLLWGLDSRSLSYTLLQLLGRPGYLVRDYISGHRQVSFPPVKMLVIVCLFVVVFESVFHLENDVLNLNFKVKAIDEVVEWVNAQKSWATLLYQSLYILPTWLVFRYAPAYPRHSLPEGFFLQVFLSVQALLLSFFGYLDYYVEHAACVVYMFLTYRQLFGYGWWSTLWRFAVVIMAQGGVWVSGISTVFMWFVYGADIKDINMFYAYLIVLTATLVLPIVMLIVTHRINKRSLRKSKNS